MSKVGYLVILGLTRKEFLKVLNVPNTASNEICHRETRPPLSDSAAEEPNEACDSVLCRKDCELGFLARGALSNSVEKDNFEKSEFPDFGDFKMSEEARR